MSGQCIHCLLPLNEDSRDHVFPKTWYTKNTPGDVVRWEAPSCVPCINAHEVIEEDLKIRIGFALTPYDPATKAIVEDAHNSLDPKFAKDMADTVERLEKKKQILGQKKEIPAENVLKIGKKIVKGICYVLKDGAIVLDDNIDIRIIDEKETQEFDLLLSKYEQNHHKGPGILAVTVSPKDDAMTLIAKITIWNKFFLRAVARSQDNRIE